MIGCLLFLFNSIEILFRFSFINSIDVCRQKISLDSAPNIILIIYVSIYIESPKLDCKDLTVCICHVVVSVATLFYSKTLYVLVCIT